LDIRDPNIIIYEGLKNYPPVGSPFRDQGKTWGACKISDPLSINPAICPKQGVMSIPDLIYNCYGEKGLDIWVDTRN